VITEYEAQRRLVYEDDNGPASFVSEFLFNEQGESTRMAYSVTVDMQGGLALLLYRLLRPLTMYLTNRRIRTAMDNIQAWLETAND